MSKVGQNTRFQDLRPKDHLCLLYESEEEWATVVFEFVLEGLERGEKCVYIRDKNSLETIKSVFFTRGFDIEKNLKDSSFVVFDKSEFYCKTLPFSPQKMMHWLDKISGDAIRREFSAFRLTGEMSWALKKLPSLEKLFEYESKLNSVHLPRSQTIALCQYDVTQFSAKDLKEIVETHPLVLTNGTIQENPFYLESKKYLGERKCKYEFESLLDQIRSNTEKTDLVNQYAHDLNNCLTMIMGNLSMLKLEDMVEGESLEYVEAGLEGSEKARLLNQQLVEDFYNSKKYPPTE